MAGAKKRRNVANYINTADSGASEATYELMGVGFTALNEQPNAKTKTRRYINMASASQSVSGYEPTWPFTVDQIRSEKAIAFICNIAEQRKTGADAETNMIIVDLDTKGTGENTFAARLQKIAVAVATYDDDDGDMTCEGDLLGVGDIVNGTFNTQTRTFTATTAS